MFVQSRRVETVGSDGWMTRKARDTSGRSGSQIPDHSPFSSSLIRRDLATASIPLSSNWFNGISLLTHHKKRETWKQDCFFPDTRAQQSILFSSKI